MNSEWPTALLSDVAVNFDTRRKPVKESERKPGPFPYYGASGVVDYVDGYLFDGEYLLIAEDGENLRTRQTPIAFMARGKFWVNNHAHIITGNAKACTRYLEYAILATDIGPHLSGAVMPKLTQGSLNRIEVPCPPIPKQKAIVEVLGSLDDRIALLRETNATLEAIAQALFKSWFVDFDPVRAKQQGLAPAGMDEATAALFPDSFEASILGPLPRGWSVRSVEELAERVGMGPFGSNIKVSTFVDDGIPVLNGSNIQGALLEDGAFRFIREEHALRLRNSCVRAGDIVLTHRGTLGQVALIASDSEFPQYVLSQSQFFLRCDTSVMQPEWMLYFLRSSLGQHMLLANASQVGVPSIARPSTNLRAMTLVAPTVDVVNHFGEITRSLHGAIVGNRARASTLANLRDTLLPRLISGRLRLPQAEVLAA